MTDAPQAASCPRTGRSRADALSPGSLRPSDGLTAFLAVGVAWIAAGAACELWYALDGPADLLWLGLHMAFVGGVSQLIVGAGQFFACAFLATEPPGLKAIRAELVTWNLATVLIAVGVPTAIVALTGVGGLLVLVGLALFSTQLAAMRRRSIQDFPWATRWYQSAAAFFAVGALLGPVMAEGSGWTRGSLLGAHLVLNIGGWFGTAIVGTLHTFYPSLTGTRLRFPRLQLPTWQLWIAGIPLLAVASAFDNKALAIAGWSLLLAAAAMLAVNLAASTIEGSPQSTAAWIVGAGQLFLLVGLAEGLALTVDDGPFAALIGADRRQVLVPVLAGWIGLTVFGSLTHLLGLMARVRSGPARAPAKRTHDLTAAAGAVLVAIGVAWLTFTGSDSTAPAPEIVLAGGYAVLVTRAAMLARRAAAAAPVGIWSAA